MASTELIQKINEKLSEEFEIDIELIQPDAPLMQTLELDSLDLVDMVVLVEHNFGFTLKAQDFIGIKTFQDFYDFIDSRVNG
ncbi:MULTISPECIES: acyl carrier protein [Parabacteroides]|jgi:acyl carrier protein|uniref:Acyl carrier protein n=1 Tax=Parabacteroides gordonii MS-1 = DSM 23371 TaxID=1203610 RepID=A0A0F5JI57_9BACT|nr:MULTISPECIES: phosphopantetheine-binding protein [Parabacteroides]KKB47007.1 acyl carrier protein [Parabacteroides sp. HGS0025]KKB57265.1 acyl carrier protein [Parabacteroides gordonii MS-1 = DSM 23371]MCA5582645.1 phosphopantetheine-binding protein [Parabacteroides gordonii]MCD8136062.1 phosphopantetheine-binding protein [Parabacteroides gordonii]RGP17662.1 acyl carrier protein [Parabacteroides gordonii]